MPVEKMQFQAETKRLLDLVVNSIYTNKEIFLRELISNASDALDKLRIESLTNSDLADNQEPEIFIVPDAATKTVTISDNGIGMTRDEVIANIGTIAKSGTKDFLDKAFKLVSVGEIIFVVAREFGFKVQDNRRAVRVFVAVFKLEFACAV